jgi:TolB protein
MRFSKINAAVLGYLLFSLCACSSGLSNETIACHVVHRPLLSGPYTLGIYVMNGDGGERREVAEGCEPDWSPDGGKLVFVGSDNRSLYLLDVATDQTTLLASTGKLVEKPVWSPDGQYIAFRVPRRSIWVIDADGSNLRQLTDYPEGTCVGAPSWSSDATRIAFSMSPDCEGEEARSDIYVMNSDGSNVTRLTDGTGYYWNPIWSPREDRIVFNDYGDVDSAIYVMNGDGSEMTRRATGRPYGWSPDGTRIYYHPVGSSELWTVGWDMGNHRRLFTLPCEEPAWSPVIQGQEIVE